MRCRVVDLRGKEVINICDGCRLGFPSDVEVEMPHGKICALIVQGPCKFFGLFGKFDEFVVPWECVRRIGDDIVLIEKEGLKPHKREDKKKKWFQF